MKFVVVTLLALMMAIPSVSFAKEKKYGAAGCGLGSVIIKQDGFAQVFAATTNGTSASQTFGITSGTSNCTTDGVVEANREREAFAEASMPNLMKDMAKGEGEYLNTLGKLYGCSEQAIPALGQVSQQNFDKICTEDATSQSLLTSLEQEMGRNEILTASCTAL